MKVVGYEKGKIGLLVLWNYKWDFWNVEDFVRLGKKNLDILEDEEEFSFLVQEYERRLKAEDLIDDNSKIVFMPLRDNKDVDRFYYTDDVDDCINLTFEMIDGYCEPTEIESYWFDFSNKELHDLIRDIKVYNYNYAEYELSLE